MRFRTRHEGIVYEAHGRGARFAADVFAEGRRDRPVRRYRSWHNEIMVLFSTGNLHGAEPPRS